MDATQLKEIVGLINSLGGDAKEAFFWYLMIHDLPWFIIGLCWIGAAIFAIRLIVNPVNHSVMMNHKVDGFRIAAGVAGYFSQQEYDRALIVMRKNGEFIQSGREQPK